MKDKTDCTHLRILTVGGQPHAVATLRTIFVMIGVNRIHSETDSERALEMLCDVNFDAVFCDESANAIAGVPFPLAARRAPGALNLLLPIFLVFGNVRWRQIERARDYGVTDVLTRPLRAVTVMKKLRIAIAHPRPFIVAPDFFGPDRRWQKRPNHCGSERRTRTPKKIKIVAPEME
jgi:PleD family two-component response regulator